MSLRRGFRSAARAASWVLTVAGESVAQGSARPPFVEDQIAGIRVGLDRSDAIVRLYGRGFKADARGPEEQFCSSHYAVTREFLANPGGMLKRLFAQDESEA